ncbi:MAG: NAD(+) synthase [Actinobacteria bacterium]|nr:NAD(+) synthase [Actinomycetota bacterium]
MIKKEGFINTDIEKTVKAIIDFIRRYAIDLKRNGALIGLSGGLDSCVTLKLCIEALGRDRVRAIILPERDSDPTQMRDAKKFAESLSVKYTVKRISPILWWLGVYRLYPPSFLFSRSVQKRFVIKHRKKLSKAIGKDLYLANLEGENNQELNKGLAFYRIKHRIRSSILFYYSELYNYLFVGTSNKSEWLTGFFVKYGDGVADIMPLISLFKTQVNDIASYLNIDAYFIEKAPSPDLIPGITDSDMLKMSYGKLDQILAGLERNMTEDKIGRISGATEEEIERVRSMISKSENLRTWPIGFN